MIGIPKFEHTSVVLHIERKNFALTTKDILQGLTQESTRVLADLGEKGWELVSVVGDLDTTESLLAFLKRTKT